MTEWNTNISVPAEIRELPTATSSASATARQDRITGVPRVSKPGRMDPKLVCLLNPKSEDAERYYRLRHALESMAGPDGTVVVGVTSPGEGDGKTLTAINLAGALARDTQSRVLLVDLDLRNTGVPIRDYLDLGPSLGPGLTEWIQDRALHKEQISCSLNGFNINVIQPGKDSDSIYELLKSPRLDTLLEQARRNYRFVVLDTPHALLMSDIELISRVVDGFLIVVKADHTTQNALESTLNVISQHKVLGLVFNALET